MGQQKNTVLPGIHGPSLRASPSHAHRAPEFLRIAKSAGITDILLFKEVLPERISFRFFRRFPCDVCSTRFKDPFTGKGGCQKGKHQPQDRKT